MNIFDPLISGSLSVSGSAEISGDLTVQGAIHGDGSGITGIPSSGVTGLNLSQITDGSATASISNDDGFRVNTDIEVTGSIKVNDIVIGNDNVILISVSDLDGKYYIDDVKNPVLTFVKGFTYRFLYPNIGSHPLRFSITSDGTHNGGVEYTDGVTTSASPNAYVQIVVTDTTPTTLYYFCTAHQNMGNSISVLSEILNVTSDRNVVYIEPSRIATTGSNVFEGDQVITGSVEVTGSITLNGQPIGTGKLDETTFNDYTSSNDDRVNSLEITSGSHEDRIDSLESTSGSHNNRLDSLETESGSFRDDFNDYTSSNDDRLDSLETESGSIRTDFNSYTGSNDDRVDLLESESGSIRNDFNSYTSSNDTTIGLLESTSGSHNDRLNAIEISTSSLNQFTSSIDTTIKTKLDFEDVISGSIQVDITSTAGYSAFSSSIDTSISSSVSDLSSSVVNYNDVQDGRLETIESHYTTTGSNSFLGDQTITGSLIVTNNFTVLGSSSVVYTTASQLVVEDNVIVVNSSFPAERFAGIEVHDSGSNGSVTASLFWDGLNNRWIYQNTSEAHYGGGMFIAGPRNTGSLGDEPGLTSGKLPKSIGGDHIGDSIMNEDGSTIHITGSLSATGTVYGTNITAIEVSTGSLNSYTSSLNAAIELTGSNLTVKGDLLVKGTTTNVNTTTLNVDNNLITLNGTGATSAGIRINDTTGPNLVSGSLLWDATNDYWIAGQVGSEQRIIRETEFSNLSTKVGNLETASGSIRTDFNAYTSSNDSTNTTQNSRLTSLESATGSYTTTDYFVTGATFGTGDGIITLTRNDGNTVTVDLDGRYLTSYTESDTLATVTSRGATTNTTVIFENGLRVGTGDHMTDGRASITFGEGTPTTDSMYIEYDGENLAGVNNAIIIGGGDTPTDYFKVTYGGDVIVSSGNLTVSGTISASNFSGTSSGTNTGDQTLSGLGGQAQLNGTGFVKADGTTISYDNNTYLTAESDTLATVISRGNTTTGFISFTGNGTDTGIRFNNATVSNDAAGIRQNGTSNDGELEFFTTDDDTEPFVFRHYTTGQDGSGSSAEWFRIGAGGAITAAGNLSAANFSGSHSGTSSGTNTGDQTNVSGYAGTLYREDNRTISPSELSEGYLKFGFTSWANNNTGPWADFIHLRSYTDSSGGNDNLVMFRKDAIEMRIYQQSYGSASAYSDYRRVSMTRASSFSNVSTFTYNHGLGTQDLIAQVYDTSGNLFFPSSLQITPTQVIVTFTTNRSGRLIVVG
jgi:hypothetical protein